MNDLKLIQKQGFSRYEFILMDESLIVKQFTISQNKEWAVKLENLGHEIIIEKDTSYMKIGISLFIGLSSILFVIGNAADHSKHLNAWLWITLSMIYAWFATVVILSPLNNKLLLVRGAEDLEFMSDKPSEKEVREFVDEIIKRSNEVLLRKYGIDPD